MKLGKTDTTVPVVDGGAKAKKFKVEENSISFEMLSSGLYSYPRQAILRELGCNALDAHADADKGDVPFDVGMPSRFDTNIRFRDYGAGISHDFMENEYTTYFVSTKRDSNDQVGVVGLGCKSPLGYTQNYTVNSFQAGKKRTYFISLEEEVLGEGAIPHYRYMGEADTTEPDGLEVIIPCKENDYYSWQSDARQIFKYFEVQPNFVVKQEGKWIPGNNPDVPEVGYVDEVGNVKLTSIDSQGHGTWVVRQGPVAYPIELDKLGEEYSKFTAVSGIIDVPMGEVHFPPHREAIKYNSWSIENLQKHLDAFGKAYTTDIIKAVNSVTGYADLAEAVDRVDTNKLACREPEVTNALLERGRTVLNSVFGYDLDKMEKKAKWYDKRLKTLQDKKDWEGYERLKAKRNKAIPATANWLLDFKSYAKTTSSLPRVAKMFPRDITTAILNHAGNTIPDFPVGRDVVVTQTYKFQHRTFIKMVPWKIKTCTSITLYVNDTGKRKKAAVRKHIKYMHAGHEAYEIIMFMDADGRVPVEAFFAQHNIPVTVVNVSDIEFVVATRAPNGTVGRIGTVINRHREKVHGRRYWNTRYQLRWERALDKDEVLADYDTDMYAWCEVKGFKFRNYKLNGYTVDNIVDSQEDYGLKGVIGVNPLYADEFRNDPNWKHIDDFVQDKVTAKVQKLDAGAVVAHQLHQQLNDVDASFVAALHPHSTKIVNVETSNLFTEVACYNNQIQGVLNLAKRVGVDTGYEDGHNGADDIDAGLKLLYNSVTCLEMLALNANSFSKANALEVISLINRYVK